MSCLEQRYTDGHLAPGRSCWESEDRAGSIILRSTLSFQMFQTAIWLHRRIGWLFYHQKYFFQWCAMKVCVQCNATLRHAFLFSFNLQRTGKATEQRRRILGGQCCTGLKWVLLEQRGMLRWSEAERSCDSSSSWSFVPAWKSCPWSLLSVSFDSNTVCVLLLGHLWPWHWEERQLWERAYPDCGLLPDMLFCCDLGAASWWIDALPSCWERKEGRLASWC